MEEMINRLLQFGHLNNPQIELIKSKVYELALPKGSYFSEAGKIADKVGFTIEGIIRVCYYNKDGEEFTRCFILENRFIADMNSFYNETACAEYIEALTDCRLLVMNKEAFNELANTIIPWNDIFAKMTSQALMAKLQTGREMLAQDASTRYLKFLEQNPGLANKIPLSALASYLGITQSSLSRIRKSIRHGK